MTHRYVVAPRREERDAADEEWLSLVAEVEGVEVLGSYGGRVQIVAPDEAVAALRERLGEGFHVELVIEHYPSNDPPTPTHRPGGDARRPKPM